MKNKELQFLKDTKWYYVIIAIISISLWFGFFNKILEWIVSM